MFRMHSVWSSSTGNGSSYSAVNSRADAPSFPQTDEANDYICIPDGLPPKERMDFHGVGNQQMAPLGLETVPSCDSFLAREPTQTRSFGCDSETNQEIFQIYLDGYSMPGGLPPETCWMQESGAAVMPSGTGTPTGAPIFSHFDPPVASLPPIPSTSQAPTPHQLPNPSGANGKPKGPMAVVPFPHTQ